MAISNFDHTTVLQKHYVVGENMKARENHQTFEVSR